PGTFVDIPANLTAVGHELFFTEFTPDGVEQLWASDGTPAGARLVADDVTYVYGSGVALGRELYFISVDPTMFAAQLWQSDGTAAGTRVTDPAHPGTQVRDLTPVGNDLYYFDADDGSGVAVWKTNGHRDMQVADIQSGVDPLFEYDPVAAGGD